MMAYLNSINLRQPMQMGTIEPFTWPKALEQIQKLLKTDKKWRFSEADRLYFKGVFNYC